MVLKRRGTITSHTDTNFILILLTGQLQVFGINIVYMSSILARTAMILGNICGSLLTMLLFASSALCASIKETEKHSEDLASWSLIDVKTDDLSLLTKYAGMPYNLIYGNPEGDYEIGGMDPGLEQTRKMIEFTYEEGKTAIYNGVELQVPDQVVFIAASSCASPQLTVAARVTNRT